MYLDKLTMPFSFVLDTRQMFQSAQKVLLALYLTKILSESELHFALQTNTLSIEVFNFTFTPHKK